MFQVKISRVTSQTPIREEEATPSWTQPNMACGKSSISCELHAVRPYYEHRQYVIQTP